MTALRLSIGCAAAVLVGCSDGMRDQRRIDALELHPGPWLGAGARHLPDGIVARDPAPDGPPAELSAAFLRRGRDRYGIYCAPCHAADGGGDGIVVRRGFATPRPLWDPAVRTASDAALQRVIRDGRGVMAGFAGSLEPRERWAVVGWIRVLQFRQRVPVDALPADRRAGLEAR